MRVCNAKEPPPPHGFPRSAPETKMRIGGRPDIRGDAKATRPRQQVGKENLVIFELKYIWFKYFNLHKD